jgi:hypothetical protein
MYSEFSSILMGNALLGVVLAILAFATAFWLAFAFRSARSAIRELSRLNQALQTSPRPVLEGRAS